MTTNWLTYENACELAEGLNGRESEEFDGWTYCVIRDAVNSEFAAIEVLDEDNHVLGFLQTQDLDKTHRATISF